MPLFLYLHSLISYLGVQKSKSSFEKYAVLGNDVVIADEEVTKVYEPALGSLGLSISYQKSLISHTRVREAF